MSSSAAAIIYPGMDVHKDSKTIAVPPEQARTPSWLDRLLNNLTKPRRRLDRAASDGDFRACYEASGAGYVLHRTLRDWGCACKEIAPSPIPRRPGVQRKHEKRDAANLARRYRAGELTTVRIRDVVRCGETFQREILKSRHRILNFLAPPGLRVSRGDGLVHAPTHVVVASHYPGVPVGARGPPGVPGVS